MRYKSDALDVLSLIDQLTVNLRCAPRRRSYQSQNGAAGWHHDPPGGDRITVDPALRTSFGLLHRQMGRHQRDASLITF
jgi:hypothetical protein